MFPRSVLFLLVSSCWVQGDCPPGSIYESNYNKCYQFFNESLPFLTAEKRCESMGGSLVAIQNAFENSFVSGIVAGRTASSAYWIGISLLLSPYWTYPNGQPATYQNWAVGQPSDPSPYQCASVRDSNNLWVKELCSTGTPFVCSSSPDSPSSSPPSQCPGCPGNTPVQPFNPFSADAVCSPGYTLFPGNCKCYRFELAEQHFTEAEDYCKSDSGMLATVDSSDLNDFLFALTGESTCEDGCPWIGLNCPTNSTKDCTWADGSHLTGYSNFAAGQPAGSYWPGVFMYLTKEEAGEWSTWPYGQTAQFFCQKDPTNIKQLKKEAIKNKGRKT